MRRLASLVLSVLVLGGLAGPVAAKSPAGMGAEHVPVGSYDFTITSDIGCEAFDVLVEDISGTITEITLGVDGRGNERGKTLYHVVTRYTRTDTGESITRAFHSIGHYLVRPGRSKQEAASTLAAESQVAAERGYLPVSQSWGEGRAGIRRVVLLGFGSIVWKPQGFQTVTYTKQASATTTVATGTQRGPIEGSLDDMRDRTIQAVPTYRSAWVPQLTVSPVEGPFPRDITVMIWNNL